MVSVTQSAYRIKGRSKAISAILTWDGYLIGSRSLRALYGQTGRLYAILGQWPGIGDVLPIETNACANSKVYARLFRVRSDTALRPPKFWNQKKH